LLGWVAPYSTAMTEDGSDGKRRRLSAEDRRAEIIAASKGVFLRSNLAGARVRDLAAAAGVTEALLYHYFASKDELFVAAIAEPLETAVIATASKAIPSFDEGGDIMREQTRSFIYDLLVAMEEVAPLLGLVLFGDHESGQRYWRELIKPALDRIRAVARRNLAVWTHREYDPDLVVDTIFATTFFLALEDRFDNGKQRDLRATADKLSDLLFTGMAVPDA
jgi:TetR/AcrR family transcriptional regulator